jgi:hypothetical protein
MIFLLPLTLRCSPPAGQFGMDLNGKPVADLAGPGTRVVVLIFAASDCPISNRYVPEVARLSREFSGSDASRPEARIWWVFPNPSDTAAVVAQHKREFDIHEDTLLDPQQILVRRAHAAITPEAAVFAVRGADLDEVYHGRIDDRYLSLGQERPQANRHDLEDAIRAALAGQPAPQPGGPPVGCSIVFLQK